MDHFRTFHLVSKIKNALIHINYYWKLKLEWFYTVNRQDREICNLFSHQTITNYITQSVYYPIKYIIQGTTQTSYWKGAAWKNWNSNILPKDIGLLCIKHQLWQRQMTTLRALKSWEIKLMLSIPKQKSNFPSHKLIIDYLLRRLHQIISQFSFWYKPDLLSNFCKSTLTKVLVVCFPSGKG